jgi:predicted helicase
MQQIKVLIAEDTKEARDLIVEGLQEYALKEKDKEDFFRIDKTEKFEKALRYLEDSSKNKSYYDIFFCDIDFTESGGRRDAGYDLIEKAFDVCPFTKICTYSGQFHGKDLWSKYESLKQNGLIVHTMDKSHSEGGTSEWMMRNIDELVKKVKRKEYTFSYGIIMLWFGEKSEIKISI